MPPFTSRLILLAGLGAGTLALSACSGEDVERAFGLTRNSPDEFTVTTRAPLSLPPDERLPQPTPGAPRPQEQSEQTQALETLAPDVALNGAGGTDSAGQQALVQQASTTSGTQGKGELDRPDSGFVNGIMFWNKPGSGAVVDAKNESRRLQDAAALGQSPTAGATPMAVEPKKKSGGWFSGWF